MNRRHDRMDRRRDRVDRRRDRVDRWRDRMNRRHDRMDRRRDRVDRWRDRMDRRRYRMDRRHDRMDRWRDRVYRRHDRVDRWRDWMNRRDHRMDGRLDWMDRRRDRLDRFNRGRHLARSNKNSKEANTEGLGVLNAVNVHPQRCFLQMRRNAPCQSRTYNRLCASLAGHRAARLCVNFISILYGKLTSRNHISCEHCEANASPAITSSL